MELESGFITAPGLETEETESELLHRSKGGYSEIWRAEKFGHFVVFKCLKESYRGDPVYEALLRKEFEMGFGLNHPGICRTLNYIDHPHLGKCIELEWVDGVTLLDRFSSGKPGEELFRRIAGELCDAVAYLHSRQIIHRDLNPANILITHNGDNVKLIDFGLSDADTFSVFKMPAGTHNYTAPEVFAGDKADSRCDIWSVGKILMDLTSSHKRALRRCCETDPDKRYSHISELKNDLLRRKNYTPLILAVAAVIACVVGFILSGGRKDPAPASVDPPAAPPADTVYVMPAPSAPSAQKEKTPSRSPGKEDVSREDIESLLQSASDLFE